MSTEEKFGLSYEEVLPTVRAAFDAARPAAKVIYDSIFKHIDSISPGMREHWIDTCAGLIADRIHPLMVENSELKKRLLQDGPYEGTTWKEACIESWRDEFIEIASIESHDETSSIKAHDGTWYCTNGRTSAVNLGELLVEYDNWEKKDGGYGRVQYYRPKEGVKRS